jgi:hypothetical protein
MRIEHAAHTRGEDVRSIVARAPDHIRAAINAKRIERGLDPVLSTRDYADLAEARVAAEAAAVAAETRRAGVWIERGGRLVPAVSTPPASTASPTARSATPARRLVPYRVVILPAYGSSGMGFREAIAPTAFGTAAALNLSKNWSLRDGHHGPTLAAAGSTLRAVDTIAGPVLVWEPDPTMPMIVDIVKVFERSNGTLPVSVGMRVRSQQPSRLARGVTLVTEADLTHVALLTDVRSKPVYGAAVAMFRRSQWAGDGPDLDKHIADAIAEARFRHRNAERCR